MIDWEKVLELREEIGDEDFSEVVDLFLEEVDDAMDQLRAGLVREKWECCLHFLKGSALNLGFQALSVQCASGESAAAAGEFDAIDLGQLIATYDKSKAAFLAELGDRLAA